MPPSSEDFTQQHRRRRRQQSGLRAGKGVLICPRCGIPLRGRDHDLGIAWRCEACGGQSLNFSQFRRMVPEHGANDIWLQAATRPTSPRQRTQCPECQGGMDAVMIPYRGVYVELDICRACQRLWLDRQEHEATASLSIVPAAGGTAGGGATGPQEISARAKAEMMMQLLEHQTDRRVEVSEKRRQTVASLVAAAVGAVAYVCCRLSLADQPISFRIACAAGAVGYLVKMLWRRRVDE